MISYINQVFELNIWHKLLFSLLLLTFCAIISSTGIDTVGNTAIVVSLLLVLPYLLEPIIASDDLDSSNLEKSPSSIDGASLSLLINTVLWNFQGYSVHVLVVDVLDGII